MLFCLHGQELTWNLMICLFFFSNLSCHSSLSFPFFLGKSFRQLITFPKHSEISLRTMTFSSSSLIASDYVPQRKNLLKNIVIWKHILQSEDCVKHHIPLLSLNLPDLELLRFRRSTHLNYYFLIIASLLEEGMIWMTLVSFQSLHFKILNSKSKANKILVPVLKLRVSQNCSCRTRQTK